MTFMGSLDYSDYNVFIDDFASSKEITTTLVM